MEIAVFSIHLKSVSWHSLGHSAEKRALTPRPAVANVMKWSIFACMYKVVYSSYLNSSQDSYVKGILIPRGRLLRKLYHIYRQENMEAATMEVNNEGPSGSYIHTQWILSGSNLSSLLQYDRPNVVKQQRNDFKIQFKIGSYERYRHLVNLD